ncbi:hypothetical protein [Campylobacter sp. LR286c]|uniref:hypothetical protein n=1 Tax=Campylobacter sp. LR286c TaxID=2593545 RepID=UPI001237F551|nr:hypothetical protein [Campylobacter sp. LR286c]KAA6226308.1 hypothetical protein FMM57_05880 [Campylobacter sp. LR286c]
MKEIKGGYNISNPVLFQNANSGFGGFIAQIGVVILPDIDNEVSNGVMCGYGYSTCSSYTNKQGFNEFVDIADPRQHQYLAITATKTISVGAFWIPQYTFSNSGIVVDLNSNGSVYKIRNAAIKGYVANDVSIKS